MTTEPTDGGPAFPTLHIPGQSPPGWSGISIRDYFAAAAMSSCIQKEGIKISAAKEAYWIADAMLAARSIENPAEEIAALKAEATRWQREYSRCFADLCGEQTKARGFKRERDELLEALKTVRPWMISAIEAGIEDLPGFDPATHAMVKLADAAIAKAEGRPQ